MREYTVPVGKVCFIHLLELACYHPSGSVFSKSVYSTRFSSVLLPKVWVECWLINKHYLYDRINEVQSWVMKKAPNIPLKIWQWWSSQECVSDRVNLTLAIIPSVHQLLLDVTVQQSKCSNHYCQNQYHTRTVERSSNLYMPETNLSRSNPL